MRWPALNPFASRPEVFLSSTSDLEDERTCVRKTLRWRGHIYAYEHDRPRRQSPKDRCRQKILSSHLVVCVLGPSYGSMVPESDPPMSIVEWEIDTARRTTAEIMTFVRDTPPEAFEPPQGAFVARLGDFRRGVWLCRFDSIGQLRANVLQAYDDWFPDWYLAQREHDKPLAAAYQPKLRLAAIAATMFLLAVLVAGPALGVSQNQVVTSSTLTAAFVGACLTLDWALGS